MGDKIGQLHQVGYDGNVALDYFQVLKGESGQLNRQAEIQDHFLGAAVHPALWLNTKDGSGIAAALIAGALNGQCRLDTGATSGSRNQMTADLNWKANAGGLLLEARVAGTNITNCRYNIGFVDANTGGGAGKVAFEISGTTITANAVSNAVCFVFDAAQTGTDWKGVGRKAGTNTAILGTGVTVTAGSFNILRLIVNPDGHARFMIDDKEVGQLQNAITNSTLITPYWAVVNTSAASQKLDADWVYCTSSSGF